MTSKLITVFFNLGPETLNFDPFPIALNCTILGLNFGLFKPHLFVIILQTLNFIVLCTCFKLEAFCLIL